MPIEVTMPRLSDTMQQGTVVKWHAKEGQKIKSGEVVADIETDKATMEQQSFEDGVMAHHAVPEGQTVAVGSVIYVLAAPGEDAAAIKAKYAVGAGATQSLGGMAVALGSHEKASIAQDTAAQSSSHATQLPTQATAVAEPPINGHGTPAPETGGRIFVSPLAKKIAAESNVDLSRLSGTGPAGRIVRKDVEAAIASVPGTPDLRAGSGVVAPAVRPDARTTGLAAARVPATPETMVPPPGAMLAARVVPLSNMRRIIARRLVESKTTIPHYQVTIEADMDALLTLRAQLNDQLASQGVKLSVNDFLVRACALAMHQHPFVNSRWVPTPNDESVEILGDVNIGIAIALPEDKGGGLLVATLRNADRLGLRMISNQSKALSEKARTKGLTVEEMSDSTFTISNLGMFGVEHFTAIINPPNAAILAVGAAVRKPVVKDGPDGPVVGVGHRMQMTMSSDHRIVDGAMAAQYLATVKSLLEKPATLLV